MEGAISRPGMHAFPLFVGLCLVERGPEEALELGFEVVPGGVDALEALAAGDDDAAAAEDEHDDGGVLGAVDEAREHAALERALDVVLLVEELEVDAVVLEVHVDVPDDVLDLYDAERETSEDKVREKGERENKGVAIERESKGGDLHSKSTHGMALRRIAMTLCVARTQRRKSRQPVSTIFPDAKRRTVQCGSKRRMVMAANFFFLNVLLGRMLWMSWRSNGRLLQSTLAVPTTLCTMTGEHGGAARAWSGDAL